MVQSQTRVESRKLESLDRRSPRTPCGRCQLSGSDHLNRGCSAAGDRLNADSLPPWPLRHNRTGKNLALAPVATTYVAHRPADLKSSIEMGL